MNRPAGMRALACTVPNRNRERRNRESGKSARARRPCESARSHLGEAVPFAAEGTTLDSVYPGFTSANWYGMFAPAGTPDAIVSKLSAEIVAGISAPEIRDFILREGAEPVGSSPREFGAYLRSEIARYTKVAKAADLKVE